MADYGRAAGASSRARRARTMYAGVLRRLRKDRIVNSPMSASTASENEGAGAFEVTHRLVLAIAIPMTLGFLTTPLLGASSALPLIVAPTGFNGMLRHQADILIARAAQAADIPFTLSTVSSASLEDIAQQAPSGRFWFQLYVLRDRGITRDLLARAQAAGCETLIVTTDCAHFGNRESERRFFRAPMKLTLPAMLNVAGHPAWTLDVIGGSRGVPGFGNLAPYLSP